MADEFKVESDKNPAIMRDPSGWVRRIMARRFGKITDSKALRKRRKQFEIQREKAGEPRVVHYFHQWDDPYSHLAVQTLQPLVNKYDIELVVHHIKKTETDNQPHPERLANWAYKDAGLIAPHYGLTFPQGKSTTPSEKLLTAVHRIATRLSVAEFLKEGVALSTALWAGDAQALDSAKYSATKSVAEAQKVLDAGTELLHQMGHYSGGMFHYGGEWYWGADRLFHLEERLQSLNVQKDNGSAQKDQFIVTRPQIDVKGVDASAMELHYYPSLNSPYTSIITDATFKLKNECGIQFFHKPVLPMIMRGEPVTRNKGFYIMFDTKREADFLGVPFGPVHTPIGKPTRRVYSLLNWAREQNKDEALMSSCLAHAFHKKSWLHTRSGLKSAILDAGLNWGEAQDVMARDEWRKEIHQNQKEMINDMGLWGVPSYKLVGPAGEEDLMVWGQDRLWLVAHEIKRRSQIAG